MKNHLSILAIFSYTVLIIFFANCSGSLKTSGKTENGVTLGNYKTYAWIAPHNPEDSSRKDDKRYAPFIRQLTEQALTKKGMKLDAQQPDAVFAFDTRVEERVKYSKAGMSNASYYYGGAGYYPGVYVGAAYYDNSAIIPAGEVLPEEYDQGMLVIQMFDAKTKKLLWRGYAEKTLTAKSNVEADIKKAVKDIFMDLPVKHKK